MRATKVCLLLLFGGMLAWPPVGLAQDEGEITDVERFTDGDAAAGAPLYKRYCSGCHGADGRGGAHTFMPHVGTLTKKDYIELVPDGYLYLVIAEGGVAVGKNSYMPAWKSTLSEQDIKDVIAHIRALPTY
jgi:mono/diheme cytochrome c family protein